MSNLDEVLAEELKMLIRSTRNERFRFIIVQFNHYSLVKRVQYELKNAYPQRQQHTIDIADANPDTFISSIFDCKQGFVFINNFEKLFEEAYRPLALGLNQRRDKFANYSIILVAFLPWGSTYLQNCQRVMPDMFSLVNPIIQLQQEIESNQVQTNTSNIQLEDVDFKNIAEAQEEIDRIEARLKTLERVPENLNLLINLSNRLGQAYYFLGKFDKAKVVFSDSLELLKELDGNFEAETNEIENNLALTLQSLGDCEGAKILLEKAKNSDEKNFGEEHPSTARTYSNLALVLKDLGDYEGARKLLEKAKNSNKKNFGEEHPSTAQSYSNLAIVLKNLGDYEVAKILLEKAKISAEKNFGEEHPMTAVRYSNLALVLQDLGDYTGAKILLEKAKDSDEKNFGEEHPTTAVRYSNLATVLQDLGDYEGAKKLLEKAYKVYFTQLGDLHPSTKIIKSNLDSVKRRIK